MRNFSQDQTSFREGQDHSPVRVLSCGPGTERLRNQNKKKIIKEIKKQNMKNDKHKLRNKKIIKY